MTFTATRTGLFLAITAMLAPCAAMAQQTNDAPAGVAHTATTQATLAQSSASLGGGTAAGTAASAATELTAVTVRGEYIPAPMLVSSQVLTHVSKEDLDRQGASTAADALNRVSGVSISQGKYVHVRGLNERYSQALLNGAPLPSPEPLKRVVPLDLFPTSMLDTIEVQKTYSARFPAEFGGGVINLSSAVIPDEAFFKVKVGMGGNSETTSQPGLTYYGGGDSDFFGYDDGTRKQSEALRNALGSGNLIVAGSEFTTDEVKRIGRSMPNAAINLLQTTDNVNPDYEYGVSMGNAFDVGEGTRLGVVATAALKNSWETQNGIQQYGEGRTGRAEVLGEQTFLSTTNNASVNGMVGATLTWDGHKVGASTMYVHDTDKESRSQEGFSYQASQVRRHDQTRWVEREMINSQLTGEHAFGEYKDLEIDWRLGHARASRESPFEREIGYFQDEHGFWRHLNNTTSFNDVNERIDSAGVDAKWRLPTDMELFLNVGYAWSDTERDATGRDFGFIVSDTAPFHTSYQRPDYLFSDYNIGLGYIELRETTGADGASAYDAGLETEAVYAELDAQLTGTLRTTLGVRYEDATQEVNPVNLFNSAAPLNRTALEQDYLLPATSLTWNFADNMQLRLAASQTIARPQFRELSPLQYLDLELDRLTIGNQHLVDTEMTNLDARFEWYFDQGEYFNAGLFYKQLDNPIEAVVSDDVSFLRQSFVNAPEATLYGLELDFRKYLGQQVDWLGENRVFLTANYTWSDSEVTAGSGDRVVLYNGAALPAHLVVVDGSRMQGQSEHLANLQIGLENPNGDQATLLVGYASERISARGTFDANGIQRQPTLMQDPGTTLDLVLRKNLSLWDTDLTLSFEARNLLGEEYHEYQELGGGRIDVNRYDLGQSYSVSVEAKF